MSDEAARALGSAAYALFALQQPLSLTEIAAGVAVSRMPMSDPQTPDWFAAAATAGSSLLDTAPELRVLPSDLEQAEAVDVSGIDLVHIYAPEVEAIEEPAPEPAPEPTKPRGESSVKLDLIKELSDLEE